MENKHCLKKAFHVDCNIGSFCSTSVVLLTMSEKHTKNGWSNTTDPLKFHPNTYFFFSFVTKQSKIHYSNINLLFCMYGLLAIPSNIYERGGINRCSYGKYKSLSRQDCQSLSLARAM